MASGRLASDCRHPGCSSDSAGSRTRRKIGTNARQLQLNTRFYIQQPPTPCRALSLSLLARDAIRTACTRALSGEDGYFQASAETRPCFCSIWFQTSLLRVRCCRCVARKNAAVSALRRYDCVLVVFFGGDDVPSVLKVSVDIFETARRVLVIINSGDDDARFSLFTKSFLIAPYSLYYCCYYFILVTIF